MGHNFTLTTLINLLQVELDWYAVNFHKLEKAVQELADKSITGKLEMGEYRHFVGDLSFAYGLKRLESRQISYLASSLLPVNNRNNAIMSTMNGYQRLDVSYTDQQPDRDAMASRAITAILGESDYSLLADVYRSIKVGNSDIPWDDRCERYDQVVSILRTARVRYPSGFQSLTKGERLTDELSTEVYRQFDEIIGALEKLNSDKQWASSDYNTHGLSESYSYNLPGKTPSLRDLARTAIDGPRNQHTKAGSIFEEDDQDLFSMPVADPELALVKKLTDPNNLQAIVKAIASAVYTDQRSNLASRQEITTPLAVMVPGYFDGLRPEHLKAIYTQGITRDNLHNVLAGVSYYSFDLDTQNRITAGDRIESRKFNLVMRHADHEGNIHLPMNMFPMPVDLHRVVDFDTIAKSVMAYYNTGGYLGLLLDIVFFPYSKDAIWRRKVNRIKGMPQRRMWELPLIMNPHKTVEEIFADLGYELLEKSEPDAKPEPAVRKPGGKRK